jgi:hypothetical protein
LQFVIGVYVDVSLPGYAQMKKLSQRISTTFGGGAYGSVGSKE